MAKKKKERRISIDKGSEVILTLYEELSMLKKDPELIFLLDLNNYSYSINFKKFFDH